METAAPLQPGAPLVHQLVPAVAERAPDAVAMVEGDVSMSYAVFDSLISRYSSLFSSAGVSRGDRVVLAFETGIEFAAAYLGAMRAGGIAVPLPAGPRSDRFLAAVADCTPAVCIMSDRIAADIQSAGARVPARRTFVFAGRRSRQPLQQPPIGCDLHQALEAVACDPADVPIVDTDPAAIIYTSGSTGAPRGVVLTHRNIIANTRSIVSYLELTAVDRVMCVLPFFYVYGLSLLHTHLAVGGSIVVDHRFMFPNVVLDAMREHAVTGFAGVPSTFAVLLDRSNLAQMTFPHLRYVTQAGGGMAPARILDWLERGPKVPFHVMYGATEASARLTHLPPSDLRRKMGSIGRPIPNVEIDVVTDDGRKAGIGEVGELVAHGRNISIGYWNDPESTSKRFGPSSYRTGDLGHIDAEGYIFLVGRRDDMMKIGGHRVGAGEIENVLHEHPGVSEAAVVSVPHHILGEVPVAFVVPRDGVDLSSESVLAFCRTRLASHKVPVRSFISRELPKLPGVGKIDKKALRDAARRTQPSVVQC